MAPVQILTFAVIWHKSIPTTPLFGNEPFVTPSQSFSDERKLLHLKGKVGVPLFGASDSCLPYERINSYEQT